MPIAIRTPSPSTISNCILWLDASAITGKNDGDAISSWTDSSGSSNTATQSTGAKQPLYKTNIQNGRPSVRFDGLTQILLTPVLSALPAYTLFCVYKVISTPTNGSVISKNGGAGNVSFRLVYPGSTSFTFADSNDGTTNSFSKSLVVTNCVGLSHLVVAGNSGSATNAFHHSDNVDNYYPGISLASFTTTLGVGIGVAPNNSNYLNMDCFEILIYSRYLTPYEWLNIKQYLKYKWNI